MRLAAGLFRLALVLGLFGAIASAQGVLTDDTFTSSLTPKVNYGDNIALVVASGSNTYIKFSLANLPPGLNGSNIARASLVLYVDAVLKPGTMDVYAVNGPWSEDQITFNTPPPLGALLQSAAPVTATGYLSLDVTSTVQAWVNSPSTNNGFALLPTAGSPIWASFDSKESVLTSHPAQLNLVLVSAGAQGPQGVPGIQGPQGPQGLTGPAGPAGPAGPQGPIGPIGATGPMGPQGTVGATGAQGPPGATGPAGLNNRGPWSAGSSYNPSDAVFDASSFWLATAANTNSEPSPANASWQLVAAGINNRGAWSTTSGYNVSDAVTDGGSFWLALAANSSSEPSATNPNWQLLASQGAAGPPGPVGPQGVAGATGPQGPQGPPGPMPTGAALTAISNTFAASQIINGSLVLNGSGAGIQFADGTTQTTAATGALSGVPSGFMITGPTPTPPPGYTLIGSSTMNQWLSKSPLLNQIASSSAVTINNKIYVVDAIVPNQVYDPSTDTWNNFLDFGEHTGSGAAVAVNGVIYRMGGQTLTQGIIGTVDAYDSGTNTSSTKKPMPVPMTRFAAVTVNNLIYAIGGVGLVGGVEQVTGALQVYDPSADVWNSTTMPPPKLMPTKRTNFAAVVVNGLVYVLGGLAQQGTSVASSNVVEVYDPNANTWSTVSPMPTARANLAAVAVGGKIYAMGGEGGGTSPAPATVEIYDPVTDTWIQSLPLPTPRSGLAAAAVKGLIYTIGGNSVSNGQSAASNVLEVYAPVTTYTFVKN